MVKKKDEKPPVQPAMGDHPPQRGLVLGRRYRDSVSGWVGVAVARYEYLNGCVRYDVSGKDEKGQPKGFVFDEEQLVEVPEPEAQRTPASRTGGPRDSTPVSRP